MCVLNWWGYKMGVSIKHCQSLRACHISLITVFAFGIITLMTYHEAISKIGFNKQFNLKKPFIEIIQFSTIDDTKNYSQENYLKRPLSAVALLRNSTLPIIPHYCTDDFRNRHLMKVCFTGRTGNHLFHLATLLAISELTCYKPVRTTKRLTIDHIFDLPNIEAITKTESFRNLLEPGWMKYDPNITLKVNPNFNWTLLGARQSYRYFQNQADLVRSSFHFKREIFKDVRNYIDREIPKDKPKVCIHVRRGDMAKNSSRSGHVSASIDFINRSIGYMENYLKPSAFSLIVVSDDKSWCKQHIKGDNIYISPYARAIGRDLCLLTQCDHNIVTSGSFGWMGAWLNETGVVIYNKMYPFPNSRLMKGYKKEDYYPDHWIGM